MWPLIYSLFLQFYPLYNLYKWNHGLCNFLRLTFLLFFFSQINSLKTYLLCILAVCSFFYCWALFHDMDVTVCLIIPPLNDIWVISNVWLLQMKQLWTFMYRFLCGHKLSFPCDKRRGVQCLGHIVNSEHTFGVNMLNYL